MAIAFNPDPGAVTAFLERGALVDREERLAAASNPNPEIVLFLLEQRAVIELRAGPILGQALLPTSNWQMLRARKVTPPLETISMLVELGADAQFENNENCFRIFLDLPHRIPSHDIFGDVFSRLDPDSFLELSRSVAELLTVAGGGHRREDSAP